MKDKSQPKAMTGAERAAAVEQALFEHLQCRMEGNAASDETFLADHVHLMPELGEQLRLFQEIEEERDANLGSDMNDSAFPAGELAIRCPHCRETVHLSADATFEDIICDGCGSCFSLAGDMRETHASPTTKRLGHFELVEQIGVGSFGTVWKAKDIELDRFVAIKIPRRENLESTEVTQFLREARAAAQLHHPNIVSVLEVGREDETVFIVSDLVEGIPLSDWLTGYKPTIRDACTLCVSIAEALQHAHDAGVVHRDLKPQNIMLDSGNQPHLLDFGLARRNTGEVTMTVDGRVLGTPAYMPPEQARGDAHHVNHQADVYSLGVILFELLTGELPFRGNARMLIHQVLNTDAPSPRNLNGNIPQDLETICLKCLEKKPESRYASAAELASELNLFLANKPIQARPISKLSRIVRLAQRNRLTATFIAISAALLLSTAVISSLSAWKMHQQSVKLQTSLDRAMLAEIAANQAKRASDSHLFDSLMLQANATRRTKAPGHRSDSLESTRRAKALLQSLEMSNDDLERTVLQLRNDAIASLALPEYVREKSWQLDTDEKSGVSHSAQLYAVADEDGAIHIRKFGGTDDVVTLPKQDLHLARDPKFSPDGRFLSAMYGDNERFTVWRVDDGKMVVSPKPFDGPSCFYPDSSLIAICRWGDQPAIEIYDTESGQQIRSLHATENVHGISVRPDNTKLAASFRNFKIAIYDLGDEEFDDKKATLPYRFPFYANALQWNPSGTDLCVGTERGDIVVLRFSEDGIRLHNKMVGHKLRVTKLCYLHDGSWLVSRAHDSTTRVWDVDNASEIMKVPDSILISRNNDDGWLAVDNALKKTVSAAKLIPPTIPTQTHRGRNSLAIHPTLPLVVVGSRHGVADILHLKSMKLVGQLPVPASKSRSLLTRMLAGSPRTDDEIVFATVSPTGEFVTACSKGIDVWPVQTDAAGIRIGPPRLLRKGTFSRMQFSKSGKKLAADIGSRAMIIDMDDAGLDVTTEEHEGLDNIAISPDGRFVASGTWNKRGVHVFDTTTGKRVARMLPDAKTCSVHFAPDSKTLITGTVEAYFVWDTQTWKKIDTLQIPTRSHVANVAFNASRNWMALRMDRSIISLRDGERKEFIQFQAFPDSRVGHIAISPQGDFLVATTEDGCRSWDLQLAQEKLDELNLGFLNHPIEAITGRRNDVSVVVVDSEESAEKN